MTSPDHDDTAARPSALAALADAVGAVRPALSALRVAAFWNAVVLPFAAAVLFLTGIESTAEWQLFGLLVATSAVALYVGHPHAES